MGLLDRFKKNELDEINRLKEQLRQKEEQYEIHIKKLNEELFNYKPIVDIEKEFKAKSYELSSLIKSKNFELNKVESDLVKLNAEYKDALEIYKNVRSKVDVFESRLDIIEFGLYEPIFDFERSDDYRVQQNSIIERMKELLLLDTATICSTRWLVGKSETKGTSLINKYKKLMLKAFNGDADVIIAKVKWNNVNQMNERLRSVYEGINKLGKTMEISISAEYYELKKQQLLLEYEFHMKKYEEKEKMRAIQEEIREEEKAKRDFEKAQREAEKEEVMYQKAIEKVRKEYELSNGPDSEKLKNQIQSLELELLKIQDKKERALSMAQQTKRGYVYIISNIGSFGENVFKIGMTRRLDPNDRVKELGDASVPFRFDVHAMIYSDEARTLEYELHKVFASKKVNMLNYRKEFFNVTLKEIEEKVEQLGFVAEFTSLPEAMEYRETQVVLEKLVNKEESKTLIELIQNEFPDSLIKGVD